MWMLRDWKLLLIPAIFLGFFLIVLLLVYQSSPNKKPYPIKKPDIVQPVKPALPVQPMKWFIKLSVKEQRSTAYTEEVGAPLAANGKSYFLGGGAVHPRYPLNEGGEARTPISPFGTLLNLSEPIDILGTTYNQLVVMDTGDVNYGLWHKSPYWVDVYYGNSASYNIQQADKSGVKPISYDWYEIWN